MDKADLREYVWEHLDEVGAARFPFPIEGRIPNFAGAEAAADRLTDQDAWQSAQVIKSNPDYAQYHVRVTALEAGKDVYVAVPRLREEACFLHLDPARLDHPADAATIGGAREHGVPTRPEDVPEIDFVVVGSVAVGEAGGRVGKGEGYSDLEYAILAEFDLVDAATPVATTVHDAQVVDGPIPIAPHDVPLDMIVTPERTIQVPKDDAPPTGIRWELLDADDLEEKPILARLRAGT